MYDIVCHSFLLPFLQTLLHSSHRSGLPKHHPEPNEPSSSSKFARASPSFCFRFKVNSFRPILVTRLLHHHVVAFHRSNRLDRSLVRPPHVPVRLPHHRPQRGSGCRHLFRARHRRERNPPPRFSHQRHSPEAMCPNDGEFVAETCRRVDVHTAYSYRPARTVRIGRRYLHSRRVDGLVQRQRCDGSWRQDLDSPRVGSRRNDRFDPGGSVKLDDTHADWSVS